MILSAYQRRVLDTARFSRDCQRHNGFSLGRGKQRRLKIYSLVEAAAASVEEATTLRPDPRRARA